MAQFSQFCRKYKICMERWFWIFSERFDKELPTWWTWRKKTHYFQFRMEEGMFLLDAIFLLISPFSTRHGLTKITRNDIFWVYLSKVYFQSVPRFRIFYICKLCEFLHFNFTFYFLLLLFTFYFLLFIFYFLLFTFYFLFLDF